MNEITITGFKTESDTCVSAAKEFTMTTWDGTKLFYRAWTVGSYAKKALVLFHGGHEHSGRFQDLINHLALKDTWIFAWDARGHGRTPGIRGYARHFHDYVKDADAFVQHISRTHGIRVEDMVMLGHSVGSVIIATWLLDYARQIRGAVLSSPAFHVKLYVPFALPLLRIWQHVRPSAFVNSYVKPGFLTHDREEAESRRNDPLISPKISVRVLTSLFYTANRVIERAGSITTPILIFSAGSDWVVHRKAHENFFKRLGSRDKALQYFPGFFHEILHEKNRNIPIRQAKRFIETAFGMSPGSNFPVGITTDHNQQFSHSLPWIYPKKYVYGLVKIAMRTLGRTSEGIRKALVSGFDAGETLDYVYENRARGRFFIGRIIDRVYLNSLGWKLIRLRGEHIQYTLNGLIRLFMQNGRAVHILDLAAGHGRYVLNTLVKVNDSRVTAICRDIESTELSKGTLLARHAGLHNIHFEKGDAFNAVSLESMKVKPDVVIVSGLYELYADNSLVSKSLAGINKLLNEGGYLIFTNQPYHPQLEFIARTLVNRYQQPWVMRLRSQGEMNMLVRDAGFEIEQMFMDDYGVFSVSIARKKVNFACSQVPLSMVQNG